MPSIAMKYILVLAILTFISCRQGNPNAEASHSQDIEHNGADISGDMHASANESDTIIKVRKIMDFDFVDRSFQVFYERFIADSLFQISRVKFPLKGLYESFDDEREWSKEKWPFMSWDFREETDYRDDSVSVIQDTSKFFYGIYGRECGFSFEMQFEKLSGKWFLTYRQENNF